MTTQIPAPPSFPSVTGASGVRPLDHFLDLAWKQESRVDHLLAFSHSLLGRWLRSPWRERIENAQVVWTRDITDPEFQKNLRIYRRLIAGAVALCQRDRCRTEPHDPRLVCRSDELEHRITLPGDIPLTLKVLLGYRFRLEELLVELGDDPYLRARAAELYAEREGTVVTWRELFGEANPMLPGEQAMDTDELCRRVGQLLGAKEAQDLPIRARRELKDRALRRLLPLFAAGALVLGYLIWLAGLNPVLLPSWLAPLTPVLLPATAGAVGAALGMLIKLRDELNRGAQIRAFLPFAFAQLVIGATAGLLVLVVEGTPILDLGGPNGVTAFSFAAGFSEAAFLGLVGKILDTGNAPRPDNSQGHSPRG